MRRLGAKREPGANPGLPRSGEQERTPSSEHWSGPDREATVSRSPTFRGGLPASPKTCRRQVALKRGQRPGSSRVRKGRLGFTSSGSTSSLNPLDFLPLLRIPRRSHLRSGYWCEPIPGGWVTREHRHSGTGVRPDHLEKAGRIGKAVKIRHGPATVTGWQTRKGLLFHPWRSTGPLRTGKEWMEEPGVRRPACSRRVKRALAGEVTRFWEFSRRVPGLYQRPGIFSWAITLRI